MRKILLGLAATAVIATPLAATAANAATVSNGAGFIGKGEVQSAFSMNNSALQKAVDLNQFTFSASQPTTQSLSQDVKQLGTQAGSQVGTEYATESATEFATMPVSQDLTCTFTNGSGTKVFHRDGIREGDRTGDRTGSRVGDRVGTRVGERNGERFGSQSGTQSGALAADLNVENRKTGQWTGWNVKKWANTPAYKPVGTPAWETPSFVGPDSAWDFGTQAAYVFGGYEFATGYAFGTETYDYADWTEGDFEPMTDVTWGEWDALPGENPDDCLRSQNADKITQISNEIDDVNLDAVNVTSTVVSPTLTNVHVVDGKITDGDITEGKVNPIDPVHVLGAPTPVGLSTVTVNWTRPATPPATGTITTTKVLG